MKRKPASVPAKFRDKHLLYEGAVQEVDADLDFMQRVFRKHRGRPPRILREDFCGTAKLSAAWVGRHRANQAIGVDNHAPTLAWGERWHRSKLGPHANRMTLICDDVRSVSKPRADLLCAYNFSYSLFQTREGLRDYFRHASVGLKRDGILVMDAFGGISSVQRNKETRSIPHATTPEGEPIPTYIYEWEHRHFDVINNHLIADIHFELADGSRIERAFTYDWRLWSLPELREILLEAGFRMVEIYIHGWEKNGEADGIYRLRKTFDNEDGWIAYVVGIR